MGLGIGEAAPAQPHCESVVYTTTLDFLHSIG